MPGVLDDASDMGVFPALLLIAACTLLPSPLFALPMVAINIWQVFSYVQSHVTHAWGACQSAEATLQRKLHQNNQWCHNKAISVVTYRHLRTVLPWGRFRGAGRSSGGALAHFSSLRTALLSGILSVVRGGGIHLWFVLALHASTAITARCSTLQRRIYMCRSMSELSKKGDGNQLQ